MFGINICLVLLFVLLSNEEVHNVNLTTLKSFRCANGKYISDKLVCNGVYTDCRDGSDEFPTCDKETCGAGKFKCFGDNTCLNVTAYCNTIKDCSDGSDEWSCGDEVNVHECHFGKGKFLCEDKLKCLDLEYTCNGECNCFDCSDENNNCTQVDDRICNTCPESCFTTPHGSKCFCDSKNTELEDLCSKVQDCSFEYTCQQRCSKYKTKISCSCYKHYKDAFNGSGARCHSKLSYGDLLIYSTPTRIKTLNMTTEKVSIIENLVECYILTAAHDYIYYTKYREISKNIYRTAISRRNQAESLNPIISWFVPITSLAVDYITNNLYFTTETSLMVCTLEEKRNCKRIACCDVNNIALAPRSGMMFYTRKSPWPNKRYIFKSYMDGTHEEIMIDGAFHNSLSLTVDESAERLYWLEKQENKIHSLPFRRLDTQITSVIHEKSNLTSSITIYHKKVLVVQNESNVISSMDSFEDLIYNNFYRDILTLSIDLIYTYNPVLQNIYREVNPCLSSPCIHQEPNDLCVLCPSSLPETLNFTCVNEE